MKNNKIKLGSYLNPYQAGVTLLELVLVIGLISTMAVGEIQEAQRVIAQQRTAQMANELISYNNGVRAHISHFGGQYRSDPPPASVSGTRDGVAWLKSSTTCASGGGTNVDNFVPCNFLDANGGNLSFSGMTFRTFFEPVFDASADRGTVTAYTVISEPDGSTWDINGEEASGLAGLAALLVSGSNKVGSNPLGFATDMQAVYCVSNTTNPSVCGAGVIPAGFSTGKIVLVASNSANSDAWLRIDGSNEMQNDISFNDAQPPSSREILNLSRLLGRATEGVILGDAGVFGAASAPDDMIIVDANQEIFGTLLVRGNTTIQDASLIVNNGMISVTGGDVVTDRDVRAREVFANRFIDANDNNWFADPNATSLMAGIRSYVLANVNPGGELIVSTNAYGSAGNPEGGTITLDSNLDLITRAERNTSISSSVDSFLYSGRDSTINASNHVSFGAGGNLQGYGSHVYFRTHNINTVLHLDDGQNATLAAANNVNVQASVNTSIGTGGDLTSFSGRNSYLLANNDFTVRAFNNSYLRGDNQTIIQSGSATYINGGGNNDLGFEVNDSYAAVGNFSDPTYIRNDVSNIYVFANGNWQSLNMLIPNYIHRNTYFRSITHGGSTYVPIPYCAPGLSPKILANPVSFNLGSMPQTSASPSYAGHMAVWAQVNGGSYQVFVRNNVPAGPGQDPALAHNVTSVIVAINTYCSRI